MFDLVVNEEYLVEAVVVLFHPWELDEQGHHILKFDVWCVHLGLICLQLVRILDFWDVMRICRLVKRGTNYIPLLDDGFLWSDAVLV